MGNRLSTITEEDYEIRKFSHFPATDTREWSQYFKTNYPSGFMTVEDFEDMFRAYFPYHFEKKDKEQFDMRKELCKEQLNEETSPIYSRRNMPNGDIHSAPNNTFIDAKQIIRKVDTEDDSENKNSSDKEHQEVSSNTFINPNNATSINYSDSTFVNTRLSVDSYSDCVRRFSKQLFDTINIGQSGRIDFNELLIAFSILTKGSSFEKVRWLFRFYDYDRDGVVSKNELLSGISNVIEMVVPNCYEKVGDKLQADENTVDKMGEFNPKSVVEEIFQSLDNTSGFLTFNDFEILSLMHKEAFREISFFAD